MLRDLYIEKRAALRAAFMQEIKSTVEADLVSWDGTLEFWCHPVHYSAAKWSKFFSEKEITRILEEFCQNEGCTRTSIECFLTEKGGAFCFPCE